MIDLFFLLITKLLFQKIFCALNIKIDKVHILSTIIPIFCYIIFSLYSAYNFEYCFLVSSIFLTGSYMLINIPGAYITSIRLRIFHILYKNHNIDYDNFISKFNDKILFRDRFERIKKHKIIEEKNKKFFLVSKKILFLIWFVNTMRIVYRFLNKY